MKLGTRTTLLVAGLAVSLVGPSGRALAQQSVVADPLPLSTVDARIERIRREEHSLRRLLDSSRSRLEQLEKAIEVRGRAYYRLSRRPPRGDFFEHAVRLERLRQALLADLAEAKGLRKKQKENQQKVLLLAERRAPLEEEERASGQARAALLAEHERQRAFELAFSSSVGSRDHTAIYSAASDIDGLDTDFRSMRGRLPFPLPGRAEVSEKQLPGHEHAGLVLAGNPGVAARSVFPGRVAFADEYPDYGRTVIVDHGGGYFTVTASLGSIDVAVGDELPAGSRLGLATMHGSYSEIYFEIRKNESALAAGAWFGI